MSDVVTKIGLQPEVKGAGVAVSEIGRIYRELQAGSGVVKEHSKALREMGAPIRAQNRAISLMRAEWRANNAVLNESMKIMRSVGSIGYTLSNVVKTQTLMQMRLSDETRDVRDATEELNRVQTLRKAVQEDLGVKSVYAQSLMVQENELTKRLASEKRDLHRAQISNIQGWIGTSLELVGVIPKIAYVSRDLNILRNILGESWNYTSISELGLALGALPTSVQISVAVIGVAAALQAIYSFGDQIEDWIKSYKDTLGVTETHAITGEEYETTDKTIYYHGEPIGELTGGQGFPWLGGEGVLGGVLEGGGGLPGTGGGGAGARTGELGHGDMSAYDYAERMKEAAQVTINQTNIIRHTDDKDTVRKIARATMDVWERELR